MVGQSIAVGLVLTLAGGCECGAERSEESRPMQRFDEVMQAHVGLSVAARNALIRGELEIAQQAMRKLAFFMEQVPAPERGREYARITHDLAEQVREATDLEEACMGFARLSYACGQCHHALDRGPPMRLDPAPEGQDLRIHMRRHHWAIERMWEALLSDSTTAFQAAAETLAEAPLHGDQEPIESSRAGVTRLAYEVHDLAFAAAVEGKAGADEYVPQAGEALDDEPTTWGQAEVFGRLLSACAECHVALGVKPALTDEQRRREAP